MSNLLKIFVFGAVCIFAVADAKNLSIKTRAKGALLMNADTGQVIFEKNGHQKRPPASTCKIATALYMLDHLHNFDEKVRCPLESVLKIPKKQKIEKRYATAPYRLEPDGATMLLNQGEEITVRDLLLGIVVGSRNDPANVLAHHMSDGDMSSFMKGLNLFVKNKLGLKETELKNPHGLHYPGHVSTPYDLALMAREASKNKTFVELATVTSFLRPKTRRQKEFEIYNTNRLIRGGRLHYPKAIWGKTGNMENSGYCFVCVAKDENRHLIGVVLGEKSGIEAAEDMITIFDAGFNEPLQTRTLINKGDQEFISSINGGSEPLRADLNSDVTISYYRSEEEELTPYLRWGDITLPIQPGQKVGELLVVGDGKNILQTYPIFAKNSVKKLFWKKCKDAKVFQKTLTLIAFGMLLGFAVLKLKRKKLLKLKPA